MRQTLYIVISILIGFAFTCSSHAAEDIRHIVEHQKAAMRNGKYQDAIDDGKKILSAFNSGASDSLIWRGLDMGGNACVSVRRYAEALDFYKASVEFGEKQHHSRIKAIGLNNIGNIYEIFGDYESSRNYFIRCYEEAEASRDDYMMGASLLNLVNICSLLGNIKEAIHYYELLPLHNLHTPEETIFWRYLSRVSIDLAEKKYDEAVANSDNAYRTAITNGFRPDLIAMVHDRKQKAFSGLGMTDSVISNCKAVINHPQAMELFPDLLADSYNMMADAYGKSEVTGKNDSVNKYRLLYLNLADSVFDRRKFNAARDRIMEYEDNEVKSHIFNLNDKIHTRNIWIVSIIALLAAVSSILLLIHYNNRRLQSANRHLVAKNQELMQVVSEAQSLREQLVESYEKLAKYESSYTNEDKDGTDMGQRDTPRHDLSDHQVNILVRDISRVMQDSEVISDSAFSIVQLAQMVHSNTTYVSSVINNVYGKNFKTYLNEFRIRIACKELIENDMLTIQAIAESVGFKSASNFIAAFKKATGMNPSAYRKASKEE